MPKVHITQAQASDLIAIAQIEAEAYGDDAYPILFFAQALIQWPNSMWISRNERHTVTGYILLTPGAAPSQWWLMSLLIAPSAQGQGVGKQLLSHAMESIPAADSFELTVAPNNQSAIALYEKLGFKVTDKVKDALGPGEDRLFMKRIMS